MKNQNKNKHSNKYMWIYKIFNYSFPFIIIYSWERIQKDFVEWNTFIYKVVIIYLIDFVFDYIIKKYKELK